MTAPNTNFDSLLATTLNNYRPQLEDNVFSARPLAAWLKRKDKIKMKRGGAKIVMPLAYALNSTAGSYNMYDTLSITAQDGFSAAEYAWKQMAASVSIAGLEEDQNDGEAAMIDLLESRVWQAEETIVEKFDQMWFGDGTGNSGKDYLGLAALVDSTGTVGNIDSSQAGNAFWRSIVVDANGDSDAARSQKDWTNAYNSSSKGNDHPDFSITTQALYEDYELSLAPQLRFSDNTSADAGFENLLFKKIPVFFDSYCQSGVTYFLNSKYLYLIGNQRTWFRHTPFKEAPDKDAKWSQILCTGNLVLTNRARQAKVKNQTP